MAGSTSISSLFRSAQAAADKQATLSDDIAIQTFNNSAQNADDFNTFKTYIQGRINTLSTGLGGTSDAIKIVGYQNKLTSAYTAFTSNEIQRSAIDVLEGNATLQDKQGTVLKLYKSAVANGDLNLAQNLRNQYDSIDVQIQNQQQTLSSEMSKANVTSLTKLADSYINGDDPNQAKSAPSNLQIEQLFKTQGSDAINKLLTTSDGKTQYNMWDLIYSNVYHAVAALQAAAQYETSPSAAQSLYDKAANIINGQTTYKIAGVSVSVNDILDAADAARNGQNLYQPAKDSSGNNILRQTKITDYVWARDQQGNFRVVQTRNEQSALSATYTDPSTGKPIQGGSSSKYKTVSDVLYQKLQSAGYEVLGTDSSGLLRVRQTTSSKTQAPIPGSTLGESFLVAYDAQTGDARLESEQKDPNNPQSHDIFGIHLTGDAKSNDQFGSIYHIDPNAETFFGNSSINSTGSFNPAIAPRPVSSAELQAATPLSAIQGGGGTSDILFGNAAVRQQNMERIAAATAASVQNANVNPQGGNPGFNVNNMPVPAGARLTVALPKPTAPLSIAKPAPQPTLTVAKPTAQPSLTVSGGGGLQGGGLSVQGSKSGGIRLQ